MDFQVAWTETANLCQAEALYRQVLDAEPHNPNAKYRLAVVCQMQGRLPEAIAFYRQLLQSHPDSAQVQNNLALAYAGQKEFNEALACAQQAVRLKPDCAEFFNNLGTIHKARSEWSQAASAFQQALVLEPTYAPAAINLGRLHLAQQRWSEAVRCFQHALAAQPENTAVLNDLGNAWLGQGRAVEAGTCYRRALRLRPNHTEAYDNLAKVCATLQQWLTESVACLQNSLAHQAGNPKAPAALGDLYHGHLNRHADALRCYQQYLAVCPDDAKARVLVEALSGRSRLAQVPSDYVAGVYDALAEQFDQQVRQRGDCSPHWLKTALEPASAPRRLDVLDLGCGTGLCGREFRDWAKTLIGVDVSANMLAKAGARGIYDELILSDVLAAVQGRPGRFDLIVASDVLLYLGDLGPLFQAVSQALRPGGRFAFTVDLLEGAEDYRLTPWVHFAHSRTYLQRLAAETALQEVSTQEVTFPRDGGQKARGLVVVLSRA